MTGVQTCALPISVPLLTTRVKTAEGIIEVLPEQIRLKATKTDIENSINNIELGGTNIVLNSNNFKNISHWSPREYALVGGTGLSTKCSVRTDVWTGNEPCLEAHLTHLTSGEYGFFQTIPTVIGKQYILSGYIAGHRSKKNILIRNGSGSWNTCVSVGEKYGGVDLNQWYKINIVFIAKEVTTNIEFDITSSVSDDAYIWLKAVKVEEGNKSTAWSPAIEDVQGQIDGATSRLATAEGIIEVLPGQINLKATKTDLTTTNNNLGSVTKRVLTAEGTISTQAGQIDLRATKTSLDTTNNNVSNAQGTANNAQGTANNLRDSTIPGINGRLTSAEGSISVHSNQIAQKVAINDLGTLIKQNGDSVRTSIGEIGGANLLIDSNFELGVSGVDGASNGTEAKVCIPPSYCNPLLRGNKSLYIRHPNGDAYAETNLRAFMLPSTICTISYWYKCAGGITGGSSFGYINDGPYAFSINPSSMIADAQWHRVTTTYTTSVDPNVTHIRLRFGYVSVGDSWMIVNCVQVEEGAIATAWTPNVNELKNSSFELNEYHARFTGKDGSYTEFCPNYTGLKWHKGSTSKDYHYLLYRGSVSNVETQNGVRIYFPAEFRGKDYQVGWWAGNVFPKNAEDLLYSANVEFIDENRNEAWIGLRASIMVRNPATESAPFWRGKMNIMYMIIA